MIKVEMSPVGLVGGVPLAEVRPARRVAQRAREMIRGIVCRKQAVPALPPARLWEISTGSERRILDLCC